MTTEIPEPVYAEYFDGLLAGDRRRCAAILTELLEGGLPVRTAYVALFQRSLYQVGVLWATNQISVATEHIATAITEGLLNLSFPYALGAKPVGRTVVATAVSPELHQVGARIVADTFESSGWNSVFVGADTTPPQALVGLVVDTNPTLLALSLTMFFNVPSLERILVGVHASLPQLKIIVGGQGLARLGRDLAARHEQVDYLTGLDELDAFIERWTD